MFKIFSLLLVFSLFFMQFVYFQNIMEKGKENYKQLGSNIAIYGMLFFIVLIVTFTFRSFNGKCD
ncbi:hypothetical protein CPAV1605_134 [seawater metagenome]|uniref:Uncharacterized protein n=1 Tax=seawater metagenome TaxID=1561972 RepID=A0A5E8CL72_9ZZZZ